MAMTPDQIQADLARAFSAYVTVTRRAGLVLGNRLAVLRNEAKLARLTNADFDRMTRVQVEISDARMLSDVSRLHPVAAEAVEVN